MIVNLILNIIGCLILVLTGAYRGMHMGEDLSITIDILFGIAIFVGYTLVRWPMIYVDFKKLERN